MKKINQAELDIFIMNHNLYLKTLTDANKKGKKMILDEVDFTDNDLSKLDFTEINISSSLFKFKMFQNVNFADAALYDCTFVDTVFKNCNFGKSIFSYTKFINVTFQNCDFVDLETLDTQFIEVIFHNCRLDGAFSNCVIKQSKFEECTINSTEFWQCIIEDITIFSTNKSLNLEKYVRELNVGTMEKPIFMKGSEALNYFKDKCIIEGRV